MVEECRKKRSHAEVAAAREQYLKEREERKRLREEQKAAQERLRQERLAQRLKKREKLQSKAREKKGTSSHPINEIQAYRGNIQFGEWYTIRFAGSFVYGKYIDYRGPESSYEDGQGHIRYGIYSFESKEPRTGGGFWIYPASRENILCKGVLKPEDVNYPGDIKFNGISYY